MAVRPQQPCGNEANIAKLTGAQVAWEAANQAFQTSAAWPTRKEYPVDRMFRDARIGKNIPVAEELSAHTSAPRCSACPKLLSRLPCKPRGKTIGQIWASTREWSMSVYASTVVNTSADKVWSYLRDFGNLAEWLPGMTSCVIEEGDGHPAGGRAQDGGTGRDLQGAAARPRRRLPLRDLRDPGVPLPVTNYRATYRISPVTDSGQAFIEWSATYEADDKAKLDKVLTRGVFEPGLASLNKRFQDGLS